MRRHPTARLRVARRLRRRAPRRLRRSSSAPGRALRRTACAARPRSPGRAPQRRRAAGTTDDTGDASDAGAALAAGVGDGDLASAADDDGAGGDAVGAHDDERCAGRDDESGRVASRPGYPAEPAARSRPFGRVSLAPPRASRAAHFVCPAARCAPRRVPGRHARRTVRRRCGGDGRVLLAPALRAALVAVLTSLALAGCAGCGPRPGSSWRHFVRRRCRLRRPPARAPRDAPAGAPVSPLVRALLRSAPRTSLRTAPCGRVRTSADSAAGATAAVPRTTPCNIRCTSRRSSAAAAPTSRRRRRRFPELRCCSIGCPDRRGGLGSHTRRIDDAGCAMAFLARETLRFTLTVRVPARPWRAGNTCHRSVLATDPRPRGPGGSVAPLPHRAPFGAPQYQCVFACDLLQAPIGARCRRGIE